MQPLLLLLLLSLLLLLLLLLLLRLSLQGDFACAASGALPCTTRDFELGGYQIKGELDCVVVFVCGFFGVRRAGTHLVTADGECASTAQQHVHLQDGLVLSGADTQTRSQTNSVNPSGLCVCVYCCRRSVPDIPSHTCGQHILSMVKTTFQLWRST